MKLRKACPNEKGGATDSLFLRSISQFGETIREEYCAVVASRGSLATDTVSGEFLVERAQPNFEHLCGRAHVPTALSQDSRYVPLLGFP